MAQMLQGMFKQVGISIKIDTKPSLALWNLMPQGKFDMLLSSWGYGTSDDATNYWGSDMIPTKENGFSGTNYGGWSNKENDKTLEAEFGELNNSKRIELYKKHLELWSYYLPYVPLVDGPTPIFAKKFVKSFDAGYDNGLGWIIQNWYISK